MKKTRKMGLLLLTVFALALPQAGLSTALDYPGEWICTAIDTGDGVLLTQYEGMSVGSLMKLTLEESGGLLVGSMGQSIPGTWTEIPEGIAAMVEGQQITFTLKDGKLVNIDQGITAYLEKIVSAPRTGGLLSLVIGGKYVGRWVSSAVDEGNGILLTEVDGMQVDGLMSLQINRDGTVEMNSMGESAQGVWDEIEGGVRVTIDEEPIDLLMADGQLAGKDGDTTVYFRPDTQTVLPAQEPESAVDFEGNWEAVRYEMGGYTMDIKLLFPDGCVMSLREDGTGKVPITQDYTEQLSWSQSGDALTITGSYIFSNPVWDREKQELGMYYGSDAVTVIFRKVPGDVIVIPSQPEQTPLPVVTTAPTLEPTDEPTPQSTPAPTAIPASTAQAANSPEEIATKLFTARFPLAGWVENAGWRSDRDDYANVRLELKDAAGQTQASISLTASVEGVGNYRDKIKMLEGYAAKADTQNLEEINIGGISFLGTSYENWGWTYREYAARVVEAGATLNILIEQPDIIGGDLEGILSTINYQLPIPSPPNVDPPMPEDGVPYQPVPAAVSIKDKTLTASWLNTAESIFVDSIFSNGIVQSGGKLYALTGEVLHAFLLQEGSLAPDPSWQDGIMKLNTKYEYLAAGKENTLFVSNGMFNILSIRDSAVIKDNPLSGDLVMHPSGEWGLTFWANADPTLVKNDNGALSAEPWVLSGLSDPATRRGRFSMISCISISDTRIYVAGTDALSGDAQRVAVYDLNGKELLTFGAQDWAADDAFGSVTGIVETSNSILVLDGNYRAFKLFTLEGGFIGSADSDKLLGTDYPWLSSMVPYDGGALVAAAQAREDESADELLVFQVKGF